MAKNDDLGWLKKLEAKAKELHEERDNAIRKIRDGFVNRAIIFMDVVGSTQFKTDHKDTPERWILRVQQFSELLASAIETCNGHVVKYIGDEVMGVFENIHDAQNLVGRISEIEKKLKDATGVDTRIKVAADFGPVYMLEFEGHREPDPQGSAVDRCARIGKYAIAGEVLGSADFANSTPLLKWKRVGTVDFKGLGRQTVFQLGSATIDIRPRTELPTSDYEKLVGDCDELRAENARLQEMNRQLQAALRDAGEKPDPEASVGAEDRDEAWEQIKTKIESLKQLISEAPGSSHSFARFIFLHFANKGYVEWNKFEGRTFDELIDTDLVMSEDGKYYEVNYNHKRVKKILAALSSLDEDVQSFVSEHGDDDDDLFDWSLKDAEFWSTYIGFEVI